MKRISGILNFLLIVLLTARITWIDSDKGPLAFTLAYLLLCLLNVVGWIALRLFRKPAMANHQRKFILTLLGFFLPLLLLLALI